MADETDPRQAKATEIVETIFEEIKSALEQDDSVILRDFGSLHVRDKHGQGATPQPARGGYPISLCGALYLHQTNPLNMSSIAHRANLLPLHLEVFNPNSLDITQFASYILHIIYQSFGRKIISHHRQGQCIGGIS